MSSRIKVLVVDDSRIYRGFVEKVLSKDNDLEVIGSVENGLEAIDFIKNKDVPDVVTLDLMMPEMNGLEALKEIQKINKAEKKNIACIMISAFTSTGSAMTMEALAHGALDFIGKPKGNDLSDNFAYLEKNLISKIKNVKSKNIVQSGAKANDSLVKPSNRSLGEDVKVVVIGSSTGGPKALMKLLPDLCNRTSLPILVVQHMPEKFTASLAESLNKICKHEVQEAVDGGEVLANHIYIAPGGKHTVVRKSGVSFVTSLNEQPAENGCRPAVDVLLRSIGLQFGKQAIAIILTGMGNDGTKGLGPLHRAGAYIIAQDEETSVVWGMPGSAVQAGVVNQILPLEGIAENVSKQLG